MATPLVDLDMIYGQTTHKTVAQHCPLVQKFLLTQKKSDMGLMLLETLSNYLSIHIKNIKIGFRMLRGHRF
jgi:hypothetical protein